MGDQAGDWQLTQLAGVLGADWFLFILCCLEGAEGDLVGANFRGVKELMRCDAVDLTDFGDRRIP
jgi:hypothetical protein